MLPSFLQIESGIIHASFLLCLRTVKNLHVHLRDILYELRTPAVYINIQNVFGVFFFYLWYMATFIEYPWMAFS